VQSGTQLELRTVSHRRHPSSKAFACFCPAVGDRRSGSRFTFLIAFFAAKKTDKADKRQGKAARTEAVAAPALALATHVQVLP